MGNCKTGLKGLKTDPALRIFWREMPREGDCILLKGVRDSLLRVELPRPIYEWTSGPTVLYPWVKHTTSIPPLTKEVLERYDIRSLNPLQKRLYQVLNGIGLQGRRNQIVDKTDDM